MTVTRAWGGWFRFQGLSALLAVVVGSTMIAGAASAVVPVGTPVIVTGDGTWTATALDGTGATALSVSAPATSAATQGAPGGLWSSDGSVFAYTLPGPAGGTEPWVASGDGAQAQRVPVPWSAPSTTGVVRGEILRLSADGAVGVIRGRVAGVGTKRRVVSIPDGAVLYQEVTSLQAVWHGNGGVLVVDGNDIIDVGSGTTVATLPSGSSMSQFSPDGSSIARIEQTGFGSDVVVSAVDGTGAIAVFHADPTESLESIAWSPNSTQLLVGLQTSGAVQNWLAWADGSLQTQPVPVTFAYGEQWLSTTPSIASPAPDMAPPVVTAGTIDPPAPQGSWHPGPVTVTWTASDPSPSSGTPTTPAPSVSTSEGNQVVVRSAPSCDPQGLCDFGLVVVAVDATPPTISRLSIVGGDAKTVSVDAHDVLSGVDVIEYFVDTDPGAGSGTPLVPDGAGYSALLPSLSGGTHTVGVRARDVAGNWSDPTTATTFVGAGVAHVGVVVSGDGSWVSRALDGSGLTSLSVSAPVSSGSTQSAPGGLWSSDGLVFGYTVAGPAASTEPFVSDGDGRHARAVDISWSVPYNSGQQRGELLALSADGTVAIVRGRTPATGTIRWVVRVADGAILYSPTSGIVAAVSNAGVLVVDGHDVVDVSTGVVSWTLPSDASGPQFSPDGSRVSWIAGPDLWVANSDGSNATAVFHANPTETIDSSTWGPTSTALMIGIGSGAGTTDNWIVSADGTAAEALPGVPWSYNQQWLAATPPIASPAPDMLPPDVTATTITPASLDGNWYRGPVTVAWTATDPTPSSGTPTAIADTVTSTEGSQIVVRSGQSCDPSSLCNTGAVLLNIDSTPPTISRAAVVGGTSSVIHVDAADALSGLGVAEYFIDTDQGVGTGTPFPASSLGTYEAPLPPLSGGVHTIGVRVSDIAGNWTQVRVIVVNVSTSAVAGVGVVVSGDGSWVSRALDGSGLTSLSVSAPVSSGSTQSAPGGLWSSDGLVFGYTVAGPAASTEPFVSDGDGRHARAVDISWSVPYNSGQQRGELLALSADGTVAIVRGRTPATGTIRWVVRVADGAILYSPTSGIVAAVSNAGVLVVDGHDVVDVSTGVVSWTLPSDASGPQFSPDGSRVSWIAGPDLWVANSDGSNATAVFHANPTETIDSSTWGPTSTALMIGIGSGAGTTDNWIAFSDGALPIQVPGVPWSYNQQWLAATPPIASPAPDMLPPDVTATTITPASLDGNWYRGPVTVAWTATDPTPSSGTPTAIADTVTSTEGSQIVVRSGQSCDPSSLCNTGAVLLNIDSTPPTISAVTVVGGTSINVLVTVVDSLSGLAAAEYFVGPDPGVGSGTPFPPSFGGGFAAQLPSLPAGPQSVGVRVRDNAGNWTAATYAPNRATGASSGPRTGIVTIVSPLTSALTNVTIAPAPIAPGLPPTSVPVVGSISYRVADIVTGSSVDVVVVVPPGSNPTGVYKLINGTYVNASGIATIVGDTITLHLIDGGFGDADGVANGVIDDPVIPVFSQLDTTPPTVSGSASGTASAFGWYAGPVTIHWASVDPSPSSGTPTTPADTPASTTGANVTYISGVSCDPAGNCATGSLQVSIDPTPPTITATVSPALNAGGWSNLPITVTFTCVDTLSGILACPAPLTVPGDVSNRVVSGTATDKAGNTGSVSVTVGVDATRPTVGVPQLGFSPVPRSSVETVSVAAADTTSGVDGGELFLLPDPGVGHGTPMQLNGATLSGTFTTPATIGTITVGTRSRDKAGNWSIASTQTVAVYNPFIGAGVVRAGGTVATAAAPTLLDPVTVAVTTPVAGAILISEAAATTLTGYVTATEQVTTTAPNASVASPLRFDFQLASTTLPAGADSQSLTVLRGGKIIPACTGTTAAAPDPCVLSRAVGSSSGVRIVVLASKATGLWQFGLHKPFTFTGFLAPLVNLPSTNVVKAGTNVKISFKLGSNQGLLVMASGYPKSEAIACGVSTAVNGTDTASGPTTSPLSFADGTQTYTYTWKTNATYATAAAGPCRVFVMRLTDGTYHRILFRFTP